LEHFEQERVNIHLSVHRMNWVTFWTNLSKTGIWEIERIRFARECDDWKEEHPCMCSAKGRRK